MWLGSKWHPTTNLWRLDLGMGLLGGLKRREKPHPRVKWPGSPSKISPRANLRQLPIAPIELDSATEATFDYIGETITWSLFSDVE